jgi:hypothetical protein
MRRRGTRVAMLDDFEVSTADHRHRRGALMAINHRAAVVRAPRSPLRTPARHIEPVANFRTPMIL